MSKISWSSSTDWNAVCRRAGGRRGYNAQRKFRATYRRTQVFNLLEKWGFEHGVQTRIASALGVSESTVSRDIAAISKNSSPCPCCGKLQPSEP